MNGIVVEEVKGFRVACGATAMALVWENRVIIDPKIRKYPRLRRRILKHELKHFRIIQKYGMTRRAGILNELLDQSYRLTFGAGFFLGALLDRLRER